MSSAKETGTGEARWQKLAAIVVILFSPVRKLVGILGDIEFLATAPWLAALHYLRQVVTFTGDWGWAFLTPAGFLWLWYIQRRSVVAVPSTGARSLPATSLGQGDRVFIEQSVFDIVRIYKETTRHRAESMFALIQGKWLSVTGDLFDLNFDEEGTAHVSLTVTTKDSERVFVHLLFRPEWRNRLEHVEKGNSLRLTGRLVDAGSHYVALEDCGLA